MSYAVYIQSEAGYLSSEYSWRVLILYKSEKLQSLWITLHLKGLPSTSCLQEVRRMRKDTCSGILEARDAYV